MKTYCHRLDIVVLLAGPAWRQATQPSPQNIGRAEESGDVVQRTDADDGYHPQEIGDQAPVTVQCLRCFLTTRTTTRDGGGLAAIFCFLLLVFFSLIAGSHRVAMETMPYSASPLQDLLLLFVPPRAFGQ
jgi:hypothetical protein